MIGLQAFLMLGGGLWCLLVGAAISRPYGLLAVCGWSFLGLIVGVFAGALTAEVDSELTLRAGVARESRKKFRFVAWMFVAAIYWLAIAGFFVWSLVSWCADEFWLRQDTTCKISLLSVASMF